MMQKGRFYLKQDQGIFHRSKLVCLGIACISILLFSAGCKREQQVIEPPPPLTVTGPITSGKGKAFLPALTNLNLADYGYVEEEYFYEGGAHDYVLENTALSDGMWNAVENEIAYFKSRIVVRRPENAEDFNGTVIMEWLNVSGQADADAGFRYNWEEILREGYIFVGVSAQSAGINSFLLLPGAGGSLKEWDKERYSTLSHPGDQFSYDMFTLAASIVRTAQPVDVLNGYKPQAIIAYGESQSAGRMATYVNAVHPLSRAFDGYFIHSRGAPGAALNKSVKLPEQVFIRTDIGVPVLRFQTETDSLGSLLDIGKPEPQADSEYIRTWEVAGTAHADIRVLDFAAPTVAQVCPNPNDGPQQFVIKAALHATNKWVRDGVLPPVAEPFRLDKNGDPLRDENGNILGGVRSPDVDVPVASHTGIRLGGCGLFGRTVPFTKEKLAELYPSHEDYVEKVKASAEQSIINGFLLVPEAEVMIADADAAAVP